VATFQGILRRLTSGLTPMGAATAICLGTVVLASANAGALVHFDFEQKYYQHPGHQVWDFSLIRPAETYHIYYHSIPEETPGAPNADTIWHATSDDLRHWSNPDPILVSGSDTYTRVALWAPDIFRDEADDRWVLAYTAVDSLLNQRILFAESDDLYQWETLAGSSVFEPDPAEYIWDATQTWGTFRDPFLYRQDDQWHILVTAAKYLATATGVVYHGVSDDLISWQDAGYLFANDGNDPWRVLESCQYLILGATHHLLFGEFDTLGCSLVSGPSAGSWSMADRVIIDYGYAPEVDEFDPGINVFSRLAPFQNPLKANLSYVARFDTLLSDANGENLYVSRPHPLGDNWASWTGSSTLANPTFGDNPAFRGDESCGLVGNGFYGSQEYFQGPLSGRGAPGTRLGDGATGTLTSPPFVITGNQMKLLVGGGNYPETCFVALINAQDETVLFSETGNDQELMSVRLWDLRPYLGMTVYVSIVDNENRPFGHINVDEIREHIVDVSGLADSPPDAPLLDHRATPNPFNPTTRIRFTLLEAGPVAVRIFDLRGRLIWESGTVAGVTGENGVSWSGQTHSHTAAPSGTYFYSLFLDNIPAASGKLVLLK
jgi:Glycosyl hydrolases family 32 N-terminal domain